MHILRHKYQVQSQKAYCNATAKEWQSMLHMTSWERWQRTCTFAKNYSYYCRQSSLLATPQPTPYLSHPIWDPQDTIAAALGNLIQFPVGSHINPALYCIRSTQCIATRRWRHFCQDAPFNELTKICFIRCCMWWNQGRATRRNGPWIFIYTSLPFPFSEQRASNNS